ncbi:MAG: glycerol-3-phosphate 1-O-acyltransferase PlsY [Alphaproteobacteria bacterium]|jgi:acyl phosphate:glycerol-3-phosphate acyltransferase|nr:glycerol-3-phosphate 1-O-acyltransferase PlsY [Alphaproteobacteria bacterium]MBT5390375.1 glycerol-3-phosphate 1-O-acyltransferase PlsY [Alphaproteobacteria bacterium]MBT5540365.1 glycerol-3-phosphate 1-O-acyltransferase PlsY [Alphaproteobacteria bacterium]MBT5654889.1 glycerol-3-phosphate 1-O-acyltransferase PlsY [Alphaproteobacteria bacterium]
MDVLFDFAPLLSLIIGYALGSIPFGLLLTKVTGHKDIRTTGSGNIGASNVLRTSNKFLALLTLLLDGGKGGLAVWLCLSLGFSPLAAMAGAVLGHVFPLWLSFKGGKGVATYIGCLVFFHWPIGLLAFATWVFFLIVTKYASVASLVAVALSPLYLYLFGESATAVFVSVVLSAIVFFRHSQNILRLRSKQEPKICQSKA